MSTSTCCQPITTEIQIRTNILLNYFTQWAKMIVSKIKTEGIDNHLVFADLCAGWGLIDDKTSILSKIVEIVLTDSELKHRFHTLVNENDVDRLASITNSLAEIELIETLEFPPQFNYSEIDQQVVDSLQKFKKVPSFIMMDNWNYEGFTLDLLRKLVNDHAADCLLMFDYKQIVTAIHKPKKETNLIRTFGKKAYQELAAVFNNKLSAYQKEQLVLNSYKEALQKKLGKNSLPPLEFKFYDNKNKTSHFMLFVTQNKSSYTLMREVLLAESQIIEDGIGNLEFNPNLGPQRHTTSHTLFGSMFQLEQDLLQTYKSQTLQLIDIYDNHHLGRTLIKKNYIDALLNLEKKNQITITRKRLSRLHIIEPTSLEDKMFISFNK